MQRRNIQISVDLYNEVIKAYCTPCKTGMDEASKNTASAMKTSSIFKIDIDGAMYFYSSIKKHGLRPTLATFTNLFHGCGRAKHLKLLHTLYSDLKKMENELQPDLLTYEAYLFGLVRCRKYFI